MGFSCENGAVYSFAFDVHLTLIAILVTCPFALFSPWRQRSDHPVPSQVREGHRMWRRKTGQGLIVMILWYSYLLGMKYCEMMCVESNCTCFRFGVLLEWSTKPQSNLLPVDRSLEQVGHKCKDSSLLVTALCGKKDLALTCHGLSEICIISS